MESLCEIFGSDPSPIADNESPSDSQPNSSLREPAGRDALPANVSRYLNGFKNGISSKLRALSTRITSYQQTPSAVLLRNISTALSDVFAYDETIPSRLKTSCGATHPDEIIDQAISSYLDYRSRHGFDETTTSANEILAVDPPEPLPSPQADTISPPISLGLNTSFPTFTKLKDAIPIFSGDPLCYPQFANSFDTHVGTQDFPEHRKFELLRLHLSGPPLQALRFFSLTDSCYTEARTLLDKYYDKPMLFLDALSSELRKAKPASESPSAVKEFAHQLKTLMTDTYLPSNPKTNLIQRLWILERIPERYLSHAKFLEAEKKAYLPIEDLFDAIVHKAEQLFSIHGDTSVDSSCPSLQTHAYPLVSTQQRSKYQRNSPYPRYSTANVPTPPSSVVCVLCLGTHGTAECPVYPTPSEKRKRILSQRPIPCWICMGTTHRSRTCTLPRCTKCQGDHAIFLCNGASSSDSKGTIQPLTAAPDPATITLTSIGQGSWDRMLPILDLSIVTSAANPSLITLLDSGSQRSFIEEEVAILHKLPVVSSEQLTVKGIGNTNAVGTFKVYSLSFMCNNILHNIHCLALPRLVGQIYVPKLSRPDTEVIRTLLPHFNLPPTGSLSPKLLLGVDVLWEIWNPATPVILPSGLHLFRTKLGPIVSGKTNSMHTEEVLTAVALLNDHNAPPINTDQIPSTSLTPPDENIDNQETLDTLAVQLFNASVKKTDEGRVSVSFPFLSQPSSLTSNNYKIALARLNQLFAKNTNSTFWTAYSSTISKQLEDGILEMVPASEIRTTPSYYIPHSAVMKLSSATTKLRIVLDASSHGFGSPSLNDLLLIGPSDLPDLRQLHLRFRLHPWVVLADIEKAFHQVEINLEHRRFTRLLWLKDPRMPPRRDNLLHLQHTRLPFGVSSSPFLLSAALSYHLGNSGSSLTTEIQNSIYVDNLVLTRYEKETVQRDVTAITHLFAEIGMNLREFLSNCPTLLPELSGDKISKQTLVSALGILWDPKSDNISLQTPHSIPVTVWSRRDAMSILASFFDPLGLFSPVILHLRLQLNLIWPDATDYDGRTSEERGTEWAELASSAKHLIKNCSIPRTPIPTLRMANHRDKRLLVFADASAAAIGVAIYLHDGDSCHLVLSKAMIAPKGTIPRLELSALLVATELLSRHSSVFKPLVSDISIYSDSSTALQWISASKLPSSIYVINRLKKLKDTYVTLIEHFAVSFHHVAGLNNPADLASRGCAPSSFSSCTNWWSTCPQPAGQGLSSPTVFECIRHISPDQRIGDSVAAFATIRKGQVEAYSTFPPFLTLMKAHVVLLRLLQQRLQRNKKISAKLNAAFPYLSHPHLTLSEQAEMLMVSLHQQEHHEHLSSISTKLDVQTDSLGLLCLKGRFPGIDNHPWLIDGRSHLATLLIRHFHTMNSHAGTSVTLSRLRRKFWPLPARSSVRRTLAMCITCKRQNRRCLPRPPLRALPASRLLGTLWERVGIDEAGPFKIGRSDSCYVLLITCFTSRAVHVELMSTTSSSDLTLALRRFFALFRVPRLIFLDNLSSHKSLKQIFSRGSRENLPPSLQHLANLHNVRFSFITPLSPWKGGMYERMIGLLKNLITKSTRIRPILSIPQFETVLREVTLLVNSRPLAPLNVEDGSVLTPRHFLFPHPSLGRTDTEDVSRESPLANDVTPKHLKATWSELNSTLKELWDVWHVDYLQALRERNALSLVSSRMRDLRPGDVVLCSDMSKDRKRWHIGLISSSQPDIDGIIRSVTVKHADGKVYLRPVESICPLEVSASS